MAGKSQVTVTLTRSELLALERAAEVGFRVIEALELERRTTATNTARAKLRQAAFA